MSRWKALHTFQYRGDSVDTAQILAQLRDERDRLDKAIAAIDGIGTSTRGRPPGTRAASGRRRRKMSAAGRARIAAAQRARWAKAKKANRSNTATGKGATQAKGGMSQAARNRIGAAQRARWAKVRQQKQTKPSRQ